MIAYPWCQHQNPADAAFCQECGARIEAAVDGAREAFELSEVTDLRTRTCARFITGAAWIGLGRLEEAIIEFDRGSTLFAAGGGNDELTRPILTTSERGGPRRWRLAGGSPTRFRQPARSLLSPTRPDMRRAVL